VTSVFFWDTVTSRAFRTTLTISPNFGTPLGNFPLFPDDLFGPANPQKPYKYMKDGQGGGNGVSGSINVCICTCTYVYVCIHKVCWVHRSAVHIYICVHVRSYMYTYICIYKHTYFYIYMYINTCIYVHIYLYVHINWPHQYAFTTQIIKEGETRGNGVYGSIYIYIQVNICACSSEYMCIYVHVLLTGYIRSK